MAGVGAGILLALIGLSTWFLIRKRKKAAATMNALVEAADAKAIEGPDPHKEFDARIAEQHALKDQQTRDALNSLKLPPVKTKKTEVLAKHISEEAKRDPTVMAQVIRTWLNNPDYER